MSRLNGLWSCERVVMFNNCYRQMSQMANMSDGSHVSFSALYAEIVENHNGINFSLVNGVYGQPRDNK